MRKIVLTGNIASGKSEVENILKANGCKVFDTDTATHRLLKTNPAVKEAFKNFDVFENGEISRQKLANLVFFDKNLLKMLENLTHPLIIEQILSFFEQNSAEKCVFVSVPQLFEAGIADMFDTIVLVTADDEVRLQRLVKRNNYTREYALVRLNSQMPQAEKLALADIVLENNGSIPELEQKVRMAGLLKGQPPLSHCEDEVRRISS